MEKCSSKPMRLILAHGWGQGKTVISLAIASQYNLSDYLVVVCPKVLQCFWRKHIYGYYKKNGLFCSIEELIQEKQKQFYFLNEECHRVIIISQ